MIWAYVYMIGYVITTTATMMLLLKREESFDFVSILLDSFISMLVAVFWPLLVLPSLTTILILYLKSLEVE